MYFDAPAGNEPLVDTPNGVRVLLSFNGAMVLLLGLMPGALMTLCADAIRIALAT
jgi:NADH-quinone oxidoreductase subunit N